MPEKRRKQSRPYPGGMAAAKSGTFGFQVHDGGDRALDGIFRLIALGDEDRPLEEVLTSMCADVADIARANVASIYVREESDDGLRFTMRGNVGFPPEAIGRVHLRPGEGITGFAAERMRPVSVAIGKQDRHFKYISGLGEEKYPALLAVPILRGGITAGVLVLQRGVERAFSDGEVVLATALAAVINHAIERGEERERRQARSTDRRAVRLSGRSIVGGAAMGRAELLADAVGADRQRDRRAAAPGKIEATVERLQKELRKAAAGANDAAGERAARPVADPRGLAVPRRPGAGLRRARAAQGAVGARALVRARLVHRAAQRPRRRGDHPRSRRRDRRPVRVRVRRVAARAAAGALRRGRRGRAAASVRRDPRHHVGRGRLRRRGRDARGRRGRGAGPRRPGCRCSPRSAASSPGCSPRTCW